MKHKIFKRIENTSMQNVKSNTFKYSIPELQINSKYIDININITSINEIKVIIASKNQIFKEYIKIDNPPTNILKNVENNYEFTLSLCNIHHDINIKIPNGKKVKVNDCCLKKFQEIFPFIEKEGFYFSPKFIRENIQLFQSNKEISTREYPFLSFNYISPYEIKFNNNPSVTLEFNGIRFILCEKETSSEAKKLIEKAFPSFEIKVMISNGFEQFILQSTEKYYVRVRKYMKFINIEKLNSDESIYVDFYATVFDVQKQLAKKLKILHEKIKPEDLIIYDNTRTKIVDPREQLKNIQEFDKDFYYQFIKSKETKDFNKSHTKKTFFYSIPEISINNEKIEVDITDTMTFGDLKKLIASKLKVHDFQLDWKEDNQHKLEYSKDNFKLTISSCNPDIDVLIPGEKVVRIKDCYKKNFDDIIKYLESKGYYYSPNCIENSIYLCLSGKEISRKGYHLLSINNSSKLELKLKESTVTLNYGDVKFTVCENEHNCVAISLIKVPFPSNNIVIHDSHRRKANTLKSSEKYTIEIKTNVKFFEIEKDFPPKSIVVDFMITGLEVQKLLADLNKIDSKTYPENIILYDCGKNVIEDLSKPLSKMQNLEKRFYFKIETKKSISDDPVELTSPKIESKDCIQITFKFAKCFARNIYSTKLDIPLKATINDIVKLISEKKKIKDKIIIKNCKSMEPIKSTQTVESLKSFIQERKQDGKIYYSMYVDIDPKSKEEEDDEKLAEKEHKESVPAPKKFLDSGDLESEDEFKEPFILHESRKTASESVKNSDDDIDNYQKHIKARPPNRAIKKISPKIKPLPLEEKKDPIRKRKICDDEKQAESKTIDKKEEASDDEIYSIKKVDNGKKGSQNKRSSSVNKLTRKLKGLIKPETESPTKKECAKSIYTFEYNNDNAKFTLPDNSTISTNESTIKKRFGILQDEPIRFKFEDENIEIDQKLSSFKNRTIYIYKINTMPKIRKAAKRKSTHPSETPKPTSDHSSKSTELSQLQKEKEPKKMKEKEEIKTEKEAKKGEKTIKSGYTQYICQIGNDEDDIELVELDSNATVQTMKEYISNKRDIGDVNSIKITFAGKELLSDIKLEPMKIGNTRIFVYIPVSGDILLMTAKCLQFK